MPAIRLLTLVFVCSLSVFAANLRGGVNDDFLMNIAKSANERTKSNVVYDGSYFVIPYPNGDVPKDKGVCTDVVIRSFREYGVDLQKLVHEDMKANFDLYPKNWGLKKPDTNIDHRRVPNLQVFFKRKGESLPVSKNVSDFKPGDIVTWNIGSERRFIPHIGIVSNIKVPGSERFKVVHNIGAGPLLEDVLFDYIMTGHYRYAPNGANVVKAN